MAENSYAQLIDDFDKGINVLQGETLTEYIKRMGGVDYESKADGGAIGIEVLFGPKRDKFAEGGWNPGVGRDTQGYQSSHGSYSGGGGDGVNNNPVIDHIKQAGKNIVINKMAEKTGLASMLGGVINPLTKVMMVKGIYDKFKNPKIEEEDVILSGNKDGGRVGLENGGTSNWWDGLEGEAKGIYDSMTAYGASDAEIQSKLQAQGLWSPDGSGSGNTEQVTGIINQNIGGGGGGTGGLDLTYTSDAVMESR